MPTNYNLIIRTCLCHPPSIRVTVLLLLGSEAILSSQTWSELLWAAPKRGQKNTNRRLPTVCSTVAREWSAGLQLKIYSRTLARKLCAVNSDHIASAGTSLKEARQSPFPTLFLGGKKPLHVFQLRGPQSLLGGYSTLETPAPSLTPPPMPVSKWDATWS